MNIVYLIGILLALFFVIFGIAVNITPSAGFTLNLGSLANFVDVASVLIVIGGTLAVVIACYPKQALSIPKHLKIMMRSKTFDPAKCVEQLMELAHIARKKWTPGFGREGQ